MTPSIIGKVCPSCYGPVVKDRGVILNLCICETVNWHGFPDPYADQDAEDRTDYEPSLLSRQAE